MTYICYRSRRSILYRCRQYRHLHCLARVVMKDTVCTTTGDPHNHPAETDDIERLNLVNECIDVASSERARGLKRIFEEVRNG